jgi:protease I
MKALILIADGFEDLEFFGPYYRLIESDFEVDVAAPKVGTVTGKHGYTFNAKKEFSELRAEDYDLLVLPGGKGPETVRMYDDAVRVVRGIWEAGKPVASICHGIQILISAGVLDGRKATCWPALRDDLNAAGGHFQDKEVVVDGMLISSRKPDDIPAFNRAIMDMMQSEEVREQHAGANV